MTDALASSGLMNTNESDVKIMLVLSVLYLCLFICAAVFSGPYFVSSAASFSITYLKMLPARRAAQRKLRQRSARLVLLGDLCDRPEDCIRQREYL